METERSVRGDGGQISGRSNCNLAEVCQYGGQAKGDGTQGCKCFAAPDCSSTEKCPLGLGGESKADGSNDCNCLTGHKFTTTVEYSTSNSKSCINANKCYTYTYYTWSAGATTDDGISFWLYYDYRTGGTTGSVPSTSFGYNSLSYPNTCTITLGEITSTVSCTRLNRCWWRNSDAFHLQQLVGQKLQGKFYCTN